MSTIVDIPFYILMGYMIFMLASIFLILLYTAIFPSSTPTTTNESSTSSSLPSLYATSSARSDGGVYLLAPSSHQKWRSSYVSSTSPKASYRSPLRVTMEAEEKLRLELFTPSKDYDPLSRLEQRELEEELSQPLDFSDADEQSIEVPSDGHSQDAKARALALHRRQWTHTHLDSGKKEVRIHRRAPSNQADQE